MSIAFISSWLCFIISYSHLYIYIYICIFPILPHRPPHVTSVTKGWCLSPVERTSKGLTQLGTDPRPTPVSQSRPLGAHRLHEVGGVYDIVIYIYEPRSKSIIYAKDVFDRYRFWGRPYRFSAFCSTRCFWHSHLHCGRMKRSYLLAEIRSSGWRASSQLACQQRTKALRSRVGLWNFVYLSLIFIGLLFAGM